MPNMEEKLIKLKSIAQRLERSGMPFEELREIILIEAERVNIRGDFRPVARNEVTK